MGWRYGIVRELPSRGRRYGMVRIEIPVPTFTTDPVTRKMSRAPNEKVWVAEENVNAVGDVIYHGKSDIEKLEERQELKREQQAKADKVKAKARRFHR